MSGAKLTYEMLEADGNTRGTLDAFRAAFPDGMEVTRENLTAFCQVVFSGTDVICDLLDADDHCKYIDAESQLRQRYESRMMDALARALASTLRRESP